MIEIGRRQFGISGFAIRLLGFAAMIVAVIGYMKGFGYDNIEAFAWTSFSFFAFLLSEGVENSTDKLLYLRRFIVFTAISEVIYDYFRFRRYWVYRYNSVMLTLLLGLVVMMLLVLIKKRFENLALDMISIAVLGYAAYWLANKFHFDFGGTGIIIILMFYVARQVTYSKIFQLVVLIYICFYLTKNVLTYVTVGGLNYPVSPELYSFIALPFIWLYDDNRGPNALLLQILQYSAYPIMLLVLIFLRYFYNA